MNEISLNRRQYFKSAGSAAAAALLAGCIGGESDSDSLSVWAWNDPSLEEIRESQSSQFEEQNGVPLEWQYYPWSDYLSKITTTMSSGELPDSMALSVLWTARFGDQDTIPDLEEMGFDPSEFITAARDNGSYQGTLYACPWYNDCRLVAINKTRFEDAGLEIPDQMEAPTWEQFGAWLDALGENGEAAYAMPPGEGFDVFMLSNGGSFLNDDGTDMRINSPEAVEAAEFLRPYVEDGVIVTRPNTEVLDEFITGNAAMSFAGSWEYGRLQDTDVDWQYVPIPQGPSGESSRSWSAGVYYSIPASGGDKEIGQEWLEYIISEEVQTSVVEAGGFPAMKSAYETDEFQSFLDENPKLTVVEQEMENAVSFPRHPDVGEMWEIAHTSAEKIWQGQEESQDALDEAAEEFENLL